LHRLASIHSQSNLLGDVRESKPTPRTHPARPVLISKKKVGRKCSRRKMKLAEIMTAGHSTFLSLTSKTLRKLKHNLQLTFSQKMIPHPSGFLKNGRPASVSIIDEHTVTKVTILLVLYQESFEPPNHITSYRFPCLSSMNNPRFKFTQRALDCPSRSPRFACRVGQAGMKQASSDT
jgi:hypothetical protein